MDISQVHFTHPLWLWAAIAIPLVWILFFFCDQTRHLSHQLEQFIDSHLLPYLLVNAPEKRRSLCKAVLLWSFVWSCLTLALAGPRWNLREMETFSQDQSLVILLDLSESMNATDIKPSRLIRAKQKIEDLLKISQGVKIGLIAFAADPHMITPLTEDKETILHLLPSLATDLMYVQGSRLAPALEMASVMLEAEPGNNRALLVISDGGFEDASAMVTAKKLAEKGVVIHVMGIGKPEGSFLKNKILSKLEKGRLSEISKIGNGHYLEGTYSDQEEMAILKELEKRSDTQLNAGKKRQFWDEYFYLMVLPTLPILLWWYRRGYLFALVLLFSPALELEASYFKNSEELGKQAFEAGDYETAIQLFQDPYRKGIACYKANRFTEAEELFRQCSREDIAPHAGYNLGNALVQQQKLKEAIVAYEEVLKRWPDHTKARENLELVKRMVEEQEQNPPPPENSDQQDEPNQDSKESNDNEQTQDDEDSNGQKEQQESQEPSQQDAQHSEEKHSEEQQEEKFNIEEESAEAKNRSQEDQDADLWLNQINQDPRTFLKNKCYIESKRNGTKGGIDPW